VDTIHFCHIPTYRLTSTVAVMLLQRNTATVINNKHNHRKKTDSSPHLLTEESISVDIVMLDFIYVAGRGVNSVAWPAGRFSANESY
jgi:hypothetical protein